MVEMISDDDGRYYVDTTFEKIAQPYSNSYVDVYNDAVKYDKKLTPRIIVRNHQSQITSNILGFILDKDVENVGFLKQELADFLFLRTKGIFEYYSFDSARLHQKYEDLYDVKFIFNFTNKDDAFEFKLKWG